MMSDARLRAAFTAVTGLAVDAPKTVTTGCRRRRLYVMTSTDPSSVTCLACREYAAGQHEDLAAAAGAVISLASADPRAAAEIAERAGGIGAVAGLAVEHRLAAAASRGMKP